MQAFIEFSNHEEAKLLRSKYHNKKLKDLFHLKINFTQKNHLRIKQNSKYERHFSGSNKLKNLFSMSCESLKDDQNQEYVIKIRKLDSEVKHKAIFNLFSIYGVILKISIDKISHQGYVTYNDRESA